MRPTLFLFAALPLFLAGCISVPRLNPATNRDVQRLDRALAANPDNVHASFERGRAFLESGDPRRAEAAFRRAIALMPEFEEAWYGAGIAMMDQGRNRQARAHFDAMVEALPTSALAFEGRALIALGQLRLDDAERAAQQARALNPQAAEPVRVLAEVAYIRADFVQSVRLWSEYLRLSQQQDAQKIAFVRELSAFIERYQPEQIERPAAP